MKIIVDGKEMGIEEPDNMFKQIDGKWYAKVLNEKGIFAPTLLNLLENNNIDDEITELAKKIALENIKLQQEKGKLLKIARKMHTWIFLHTDNEKEVYDELGLTDEENAILGYGGQFIINGDKE